VNHIDRASLVTAVKQAADGIVITDIEGQIQFVNPAFTAMTGYSSQEILGQNPRVLKSGRQPATIYEDLWRMIRSGQVWQGVLINRRKDGTLYDEEMRIAPVRDPLGEIAGFIAIKRDVTERKRTEAALRENAEALMEAQRIGALGCYALDIPADCWTGSNVLDEIFGIGQEYGRTVAGWEALVHADDRAMMASYFADEVVGQRKPFDKEYRIVRQMDQQVRWVHGTGKLGFDIQGNPLKMYGVIRDISERKRSEEQLRESEARHRETFEQAAVGIIHASIDGRCLWCNARFAEIVGYSLKEVADLTLNQITPLEDGSRNGRILDRMAGGALKNSAWERRFIRKDGSIVWVRITASTQLDRAGLPLHLIAFVEDVTERKVADQQLAAAQRSLEDSELHYRTVFQTSPDAITITRLEDGRYVDVNRTFLDAMGYESDELIGHTVHEINLWVDPRKREEFVKILRRQPHCRNMEAQLRKKNGEIVSGLLSAAVIELDGVSCALTFLRDITSYKDAEEKIRNLAFYDPLTGLPNRRLLMDRLEVALASGSLASRMRTLLSIDLNDFKTLNDFLGHHTGDLLLQQFARRLSSLIREKNAVARLGADEFVVMLDPLSSIFEEAAQQAESVASEILASAQEPYLLDGREYHLALSIGIAIFGDRPEDPAGVLQRADIARHQAKISDGNAMCFFSPALQVAVNARAAMEEDLRHAIKAEEFVLYYQPQLDSAGTIGAEALIRWNHPRRGILAPGDFIPLAEETGLILPLGDWVLETACAQLAAWAAHIPMANLTLAVNISAVQFCQPEFVDQVLAVIQRTGANPRKLKLELTESMLVENVEETIVRMKTLKAHGVEFSVDDFGTGYSSLNYLRRLPLDQLKIDRAFVRDMMADIQCEVIAQTIISLGHALGLSVIAEGVETESQRDHLEELGCHSFQGYLFSRPLPLNEFELFLSAPAQPQTGCSYQLAMPALDGEEVVCNL
jgi:diguanylate cyclase (GGDEF)-like protein/PAS domain S-box-containing protein